MPCTQRRNVRIEASRPASAFPIYFFLPDDGTWCVFPLSWSSEGEFFQKPIEIIQSPSA
jgi:hypothetical protein